MSKSPDITIVGRVTDYVHTACKSGQRTPALREAADATGLTVDQFGRAFSKLVHRDIVKRVNGGTKNVVWHWVPTGERTAERRDGKDLEAVRNYVRDACRSHRLTPSATQIASVVGLSSHTAVYRLLRELEDRGEIERKGYQGGLQYVWVASGSTTRPRPGKLGCQPVMPRPSPPSRAEITAARKALAQSNRRRAYAVENNPIAVADYGVGRPPGRPGPNMQSNAALCVGGA